MRRCERFAKGFSRLQLYHRVDGFFELRIPGRSIDSELSWRFRGTGFRNGSCETKPMFEVRFRRAPRSTLGAARMWAAKRSHGDLSGLGGPCINLACTGRRPMHLSSGISTGIAKRSQCLRSASDVLLGALWARLGCGMRNEAKASLAQDAKRSHGDLSGLGGRCNKLLAQAGGLCHLIARPMAPIRMEAWDRSLIRLSSLIFATVI